MDCTSLNQYEEQLYSVFKTFDVDNEEALNKAAVLALCDALQLEERGAALADSLFERRTQRVTFAQFRSGLLAVLGDPPPACRPAAPAAPAAAPSHSDDDSSGREVAPKFVVGSKKYGRRSRPSRASSAPDDAPPPDPGPDPDPGPGPDPDPGPGPGPGPARRMRCKRSASAMDARGAVSPSPDLDHESRIDCERALALCGHLRMDGIDRRLVERIFEEAPAPEITVGEFFDRLNASLTTSIAGASDAAAGARPDDDDDEEDDEDGALPGELVAEAWERAGVRRPRRLLAELGFEAAALRAPDLERALDDELRALAEPPDARSLLLLAALALSRLRRRRARRRAADAAAERDRLRADVAESNRRARLLAQEVDENHARLEAELTASLRRAEARHAEAARVAEAERAAERERLAAARAALEAEVARRAEAEARLRGEAGALRRRALELEARAAAAEEGAGAAERERARLGAALREALQRAGAAPRGERAAGELEARVAELRAENTRLRDRCDELAAELEPRARVPGPAPAQGPAGASWREEAGEEPAAPPPEDTEECDSLPLSPERRRRGSQSQSQVTSQSRAAQTDADAAAPEPRECACGARARPAGAGAGADADAEKHKLTELVNSLESSLEQMRVEYERCEEYWHAKLAEERDAFAEEQRASDERLAELVDKIAEYERQFTRSLPTIDEKYSLELQVTSLEEEFEAYKRQQQAELRAARDELLLLRARQRACLCDRSQGGSGEAEAGAEAAPPSPSPCPGSPGAPAGGARPQPPLLDAAAGAAAGAAVGAGAARCSCAALGALAAGLRARLGRLRGAHAAEAGALRARLARAHAHAASLAARLHAADLLVKDLYVENCLLGPLPHPRRL